MIGLICLLCLAPVDLSPVKPSPKDDVARAALGKGNYPWYDSKQDALRPVDPPEPPPAKSVDANIAMSPMQFNLGTIIYILMALLIVAAIAAIVWSMNKYFSKALPETARPSVPGRAARAFGPLPLGLEVDEGDPWTAAERARAAGDYGKAILYLFAYELYALDEARLIRLAPGKTCRQLVRGLNDDKTRSWVEPALGLFEAAYYGRRPPSRDAFEHARKLAEDLRALVAAEGGKR
ncbi:MAG: hypothetical protein NVSMB14_07540 [Isosphaeraceae bacterium]